MIYTDLYGAGILIYGCKGKRRPKPGSMLSSCRKRHYRRAGSSPADPLNKTPLCFFSFPNTAMDRKRIRLPYLNIGNERIVSSRFLLVD